MRAFYRSVFIVLALGAAFLKSGISVAVAPAKAPLAASASRPWNARGEEIVRLVRDHFYDSAAAQAWASKYQGYGAATKSEAEFVTATRKALAELHASHTEYYTRQHQEYYGIASIFGGILKLKDIARDSIGADFTEEHFVRAVFADSPAAKAGLRRGDRVLQADGKPFESVRSFQGHTGHPVMLTVERTAGQPALTLSVTPRHIDAGTEYLEAQKAGTRLIKRGSKSVMYVPFFCGAGEQYQEALETAITSNFASADALVLDFRNGWGGCDPRLVNLFTTTPALLEYTDRAGKHLILDVQWRKPIVLLINGGVRSGKEVVAYSLQEHRRATLVGTNTAGAVMAGQCFALSDGSLLYLAVRDVTVDGVRLEGKGVAPDVSVPDDLPYANGADPQWEKALDIATQ